MVARRAVQGLALVGVACAVAALVVAGFSSGPQPRSALLSRAARQPLARRSQGALMQQLEGPNAVSVLPLKGLSRLALLGSRRLLAVLSKRLSGGSEGNEEGL